MIKEEWKDINGFEGYYQISNLGRVKSLPRVVRNFITKEKILKNHENSQGYYRVELKVKGLERQCFVHRLVAEHFINKPKGCDVVNHLDCNPHNNCIDNLEWTTLKGNVEYMKKLGRNKRTEQWIKHLKKGLREKIAKKVIGTKIDGNQTLIYETVNDVAIDGFQPSCVSNCCNNKRKTHKGFTWRFANEINITNE